MDMIEHEYISKDFYVVFLAYKMKASGDYFKAASHLKKWEPIITSSCYEKRVMIIVLISVS